MKYHVPHPDEWLVKLNGRSYVYDPWEQRYYLYFSYAGICDFSTKANEYVIVDRRGKDSKYCRTLLRVMKAAQKNPDSYKLPEKPTLRKQPKFRKKRVTKKKKLEDEIKQREMRLKGS